MEGGPSYRTYWIAWGLLLILTLFMIFVEAVRLPGAITILILAMVMLIKATVIGGWFMHLKFERPALVVAVAVAILGTAAFMFFLLVPDGLAMLHLAPK